MFQSLITNWQVWTALGTLLATWVYVILVFITLFYIAGQFREARSDRKRETALSAFRELQTKEARDARRYIYGTVPLNLEGLNDELLQQYLEAAEEAMLAFERIGYLIYEGHVDSEPILVNHWPVVWKSWKKTQGLIVWARGKRGEVTYFNNFDYLFQIAEKYRVQHGYPEPKFY